MRFCLEKNEGLDLTRLTLVKNENIRSIAIFSNVPTIIFPIVVNYIKIISILYQEFSFSSRSFRILYQSFTFK